MVKLGMSAWCPFVLCLCNHFYWLGFYVQFFWSNRQAYYYIIYIIYVWVFYFQIHTYIYIYMYIIYICCDWIRCLMPKSSHTDHMWPFPSLILAAKVISRCRTTWGAHGPVMGRHLNSVPKRPDNQKSPWWLWQEIAMDMYPLVN